MVIQPLLAESSQPFGGPFDGILTLLCRRVVSKLPKDSTRRPNKDAVVVYEHSHKSDSLSLDNFELSNISVMVLPVDLLVR